MDPLSVLAIPTPEACDNDVHDHPSPLPPAIGSGPASGVDLRHSTFNNVTGNMHNYYSTFVYKANWLPPPSLSFNEARNRLSPHFTGREEEIKHIRNALGVPCDNAPTRYAIYGRAGLGKTQLASKYAELSYPQRYSVVIWISGATVENLTQGFTNILSLIDHPDCRNSNQTQSAKLTSARRWLEESGSIRWLLILDNIAEEAVGFLREYLPQKNLLGNILLTTRSPLVAEAVAGRQCQVLELHDPGLHDAAKQLLAETGINSPMSSAEHMVKFVGRLPLLISQVASLVKHVYHSLDKVLLMYQDKGKYEVCYTF
jgi:Cdc6-like AAA superfamily ATPase